MSTVSKLQAHLEAAAAQVAVVDTPVEQIKSKARQPYVWTGMAAAAVLVMLVAVTALVRGNNDELISPPPPIAEGQLDSGITDLLPPAFDPADALALFSATGDATTVTTAYLESRVRVETAVVSVTELEDGLVAVRWGWGRVAGVNVTSDEGKLGWIVLRASDSNGYGVIAATTDGVDLSMSVASADQISAVVRWAPSEALALDILDMDGVPIPGADSPNGELFDGDRQFATAGMGESGNPADSYTMRFDSVGIGAPVVVRAQMVGGTLLTVSEVVIGGEAIAEPAPTTTTPLETTTTTTTSMPPSEPTLPLAWTEAEAERHVENYLAALAAGAYAQAAWPTENNGVVFDGQSNDETPTDYLTRICADGACRGPYTVDADGPGLINEFSQASSTVTVTDVGSGESTEITLGTFEGQLMVMGLPPLVTSSGSSGLVEQLFGDDLPDRVVVQRFDAFEIWEEGGVEWVTNWNADEATHIEGDLVATWSNGVVGLLDPAQVFAAENPYLVTRNDEVLVVENRWDDPPTITEPLTGEARPSTGFDNVTEEGGYAAYYERAGVVLLGEGDAEGNLVRLVSDRGVDLAGDDYIGFLTMSVDGARVVYGDHRDAAAYSHFWSPVVVLKDVQSGNEIDRWVLDGPVVCLEFSGDWIIACEGSLDADELASGNPAQTALVAINTQTGAITRVSTRTMVFLPS